MKPKYGKDDVLKYGDLRYFIVDVIEDYDGRYFYMCCEATMEGQLDFNNVAAFEIVNDDNGNELIGMLHQESDIFRELLTLEAHNASMELIPEYKEKLEEALDMLEE